MINIKAIDNNWFRNKIKKKALSFFRLLVKNVLESRITIIIKIIS